MSNRSKEWIWMIWSLLGFFTGPGHGYSIIEGPRNTTVLVGSVAQFSCTVSDGWEILIWLFNGHPKLSVLRSGKPIQTYHRYSQKGHFSGSEFTSELMINDVQLNDSGRVTCSLQHDASESAFLSVQVNGSLNIRDSNLAVRKNQTIEIVCEAFGWAPAPHMTWMVNNISVANSEYVTGQSQGSNGLYNEESILTLTPMTNDTVTCLATIDALSKPQYSTVTFFVYDEPPQMESGKNEDDWRTRTIILAVVLSVVGFLLLILIILLIICCCKRREESNYQKELRKVSEKKTTNRNMETMRGTGHENYGYSPDTSRQTNITAGVPAFAPINPSFYGPEQDLEVNPASEISSQLSSPAQSFQRMSPVPSLYSEKYAAQVPSRRPQVQFRIPSSETKKSRVHQPNSWKLYPQTQQFKGQRLYSRSVYPQKQQSSSQHAYIRRLAHQDTSKKSKIQDHKLPTQHSRKHHTHHRGQEMKRQLSQARALPQHYQTQASRQKQIYPRNKTDSLRVQPSI